MITHLEHQIVVRVGVAGERRRRRRLEEHDEPVAAYDRRAAPRTAASPATYVLPFPGSTRRAELDEELVGERVDLGVANCMRSARGVAGRRLVAGLWRGSHACASSCTGTFSYSPLGVRHLCSDVQKVIIRRVKACHTAVAR